MSPAAQMPSLLFTMMLLLWGAVSVISAQGRPWCLSKVHQDKTVNVRVAFLKKTTVMRAIFHPSEKDCLKACCSTDSKDFTCNLVIFRPAILQRSENCYLFHCERDEDCPLITMNEVNTYNIFKGLEIINAEPSTTTNTTTATTTTTHSTSSPAPSITLRPTTTRPPSTATPTTAAVIAQKQQPAEKPVVNDLPSLPVTPFPIKNMASATANQIFSRAVFKSTPQPAHPRAGGLTPPEGRETGTSKGRLVAAVAAGLVCLTCVVALVGKKVAGSFSHRKYTRLELNDLKYDIQTTF